MGCKEIFSMRKYLSIIGWWDGATKSGKFMIQRAYKLISGVMPNVPWRSITCSNPASPKALFIIHGKLRKKDLLMGWG